MDKSFPLLDTPEDILVKIVELLEPADQLAAARACRALKACADVPRLRYERTLKLAGYLDVPNRPKRTGRSASMTEVDMADISSRSTSFSRLTPADISDELDTVRRSRDSLRSPHTGKIRQSIPSVRFPPWPRDPPSTLLDTSDLSLAEKTELLSKREAAWDTLTPRQVRTFCTTGAAGVYELQEGIYLLCMAQDFDFWAARPRQIRLIPLPSASDPDLDDPLLPCKEVTMSFDIADLTMDPTQDLIVVAESNWPSALSRGSPAPVFKYHLLTMSTFEPHPLAEMPVLDFPPTFAENNVAQQLIQVMGDTMVALVAVVDLESGDHALAHEEMVAWNWKTGNVLGRVNIGRTLARCTMAILTPTTVALAMPGTTTYEARNNENLVPAAILGHPDRVAGRPSIDIYSFAQPEEVKVQQPLARDDEDVETPRACLLTRLLFPSISGKLVHQLHMRPDPPFPPNQGGLGNKPFGLDPRTGVLVIELQLDEYIPLRRIHLGVPEKYEIFVLRSTLVDMAEEAEASWLGQLGTREYPLQVLTWEEWGEDKARMMEPTMPLRQWVCSCSGYRYASVERFRNVGGVVQRTEITVHDFNPHSITRERAAMRQARENEELDEAELELSRESMTDDLSSEFLTERFNDMSEPIRRKHDEPGVSCRTVREPVPPEVESFVGNECHIELHTGPEFIDPLLSSFDDLVVSRLPYRTVTRQVLSNPEGVMVEDQRLLLISGSDHNDSRRQRSDVTVLCF